MPLLEDVRERMDWTYFDTLLSLEASPERQVQPRERLFEPATPATTEAGSPHLQPSDMAFTINTIRVAMFFERFMSDDMDDHATKYARILCGTVLTPFLNGKPRRPIQTLRVLDDASGGVGTPYAPLVEVGYQCGPLGIYPRQPFYLQVDFSPSTVELINDAAFGFGAGGDFGAGGGMRMKRPLRRFFRVFLDGVLAREAC